MINSSNNPEKNYYYEKNKVQLKIQQPIMMCYMLLLVRASVILVIFM